MPSSPAQHYEALLAEHYTWMSGGLEANVARNAAFFAQHGIARRGGGVAVDLGAGPGYQTVPLARAGFRVYAVDLSERLLAETRKAAEQFKEYGLEVITVHGDLVTFAQEVR